VEFFEYLMGWLMQWCHWFWHKNIDVRAIEETGNIW
jgi:hypothetical protein